MKQVHYVRKAWRERARSNTVQLVRIHLRLGRRSCLASLLAGFREMSVRSCWEGSAGDPFKHRQRKEHVHEGQEQDGEADDQFGEPEW